MEKRKVTLLAIALMVLSISIKAQPGNYCSLAPPSFTADYSIPFGGFRLYFPGQGLANTNAIGVGYTCTATLPAKLSVFQQTASITSGTTAAGSFLNRDINAGGTSIFRGVGAACDQAQTLGITTHVGGDFKAGGANSDYAVRGIIVAGGNPTLTIAGDFSNTINTAGASYGIRSQSSNNSVNYGVYTSAASTASVPSYGIFALNSGTATNNMWAGWFQGDVNITGNGYIPAIWITSDKRYKENIKKLENIHDKINKLSGYSYNFKTEEFKEKSFSKGEQIGLIAQEVKEVFPQLVTQDSKGYFSVNYQGMIPVLLEAIKDQQNQINELKTLVKTTANTVSESSKIIATTNLSDAQIIVLEQNVPNPFAEQTIIAYSLPDGIQKAQILFYNADGKLINSSDLKAVAGKGQLNVFASDLSNGVYSYSLIIDGKIAETKRMIKTK